MSKKMYYSAPEAELLAVMFEENILSFDDDNNTEIITPDDDEDL